MAETIILKEYEICPKKDRCEHYVGCYGTKEGRNGEFRCSYFKEKLKINTSTDLLEEHIKKNKLEIIHG